MSHSPFNRPHTPSPDEEVTNEQEIHHPDGTVHRHKEIVRQNDPALEQRLERERLAMDRHLQIRDNDNAARGLLVGVIATTFLGLGILTWFLLTNRQEPETAPVVVPAQPSEPTTPSSPPDINITLPDPPAATESTTEIVPTQPTVQTQPAPMPSQPSSSSQPNDATAPAGNQSPNSAPAATDQTDPAPANPSTSNGPTSAPAAP